MPVARRFACSAILLPLLAGALPASRSLAAELAIPAPDAIANEAAADPPPAGPELECMAKVVMHEAGSEPHQGKVAVAQTLVNRLAAGRFGGTICQVANQPGQFFNTAAYQPDRGGDGWADAVGVARAVLTGAEAEAAPGAMFFRAASSPACRFFRNRQRVAAVGAQIFYR